MYFSIKPWCEAGETASECLLRNPTLGLNTTMEAGLYRYQGTDTINNYVCFGTTVKSECVGNTDAYMYRIIGINSSYQVKLIKKEALNTGVKWWDNSTYNIEWPSSNIYTTLNGNDYLLNDTYVPTGWESKIATTTWKYGDTESNGNYNGVTIYAIENAWTSTVSAKIGLMYIHDYYYAYALGGTPESSSNAVTAWIHLSENDTSAPSTDEWTMSRRGFFAGVNYRAWNVASGGTVGYPNLAVGDSVRPVFYLTSEVKITSGTGTATDPFIIN